MGLGPLGPFLDSIAILDLVVLVHRTRRDVATEGKEAIELRNSGIRHLLKLAGRCGSVYPSLTGSQLLRLEAQRQKRIRLHRLIFLNHKGGFVASDQNSIYF